MATGDNTWIVTKTGGSKALYFNLYFEGETKIKPRTFLANMLAKMNDFITDVATDIESAIFPTMTAETNYVSQGAWSINLENNFVALTLPLLMIELVEAFSTTLFVTELAAIEYLYYEKILTKIFKRSTDNVSTLEARAKYFATNMWALHIIKESRSIVKTIAGKFHTELRVNEDRVLLQQSDVNNVSVKLLALWRKDLAQLMYNTLSAGTASVAYANVSAWLDSFTMMRQTVDEPYTLLFLKQNETTPAVTIRDKSKWWFQVTSRCTSFGHNRYTVDEHGMVKEIMSIEEIDREILDWETLSWETAIEVTKTFSELLPYATKNVYIDISKVSTMFMDGKLTLPTQTGDFVCSKKDVDVVRQLLTFNRIDKTETAKLEDLFIKQQIGALKSGGDYTICGTSLTTTTTLFTEMTHIFALRSLAMLFPVSTESGRITVSNDNVFGKPGEVYEYFAQNDNVYLNTTFVNRFLKYLNIPEEVVISELSMIGHEVLMKCVKMFKRIGIEKIKQEIFASFLTSINGSGNLIRSSKLHLEYGSSISTGNQSSPFAAKTNCKAESFALKSLILNSQSTQWKELMLHALAIAISFNTSTEEDLDLLNDVFVGEA